MSSQVLFIPCLLCISNLPPLFCPRYQQIPHLFPSCLDCYGGFSLSLPAFRLSPFNLPHIPLQEQSLQNRGYTSMYRLPSWLSGKEPTCHCRSCRRRGFDPWIWKLPWRRKWQPTPVFLPGKSHGQRILAGYSPWGHRESDPTERLTLCAVLLHSLYYFFLFFVIWLEVLRLCKLFFFQDRGNKRL